MQIQIFKDYKELSGATANTVIELIKNKPDAVICLASGETPRLTCQLIAERVIKEKIDLSQISFIGLDEWVGIPPANEGSCRYFFDSLLLQPMKLPASQTYLFNALSNDLHRECETMDKVIFEKGGLDLIIVGIGMNGHIGFNEPGVSFDKYSHVIELDETTVSVGQKYFKKTMELKQGITLGLKHLMESRKAILIANGSKKAEVIRRTVKDPVNNFFPATIMQQHPNGFILTDKEAASLLHK